MGWLQSVFSAAVGLGTVLWLPIGILLLGLLLRLQPLKALKSGILIVLGYVGLKMMVAFICDAMEPVITAFSKAGGYTVVDVGWQALAVSSWMMPFAFITVVAGFVINVFLIRRRAVRTLNTDIWDYCHILFCGAIGYVLFRSFWLSAALCLVTLLITLKCGDKIAPRWEEHLESPGTTGSVFFHLTTMFPVYYFCDWVIGHIPGLKKIELDATKLVGKISILGDPVYLGVLIGLGLGCAARLPLATVVNLCLVLALSLVLTGRITALVMEGLAPVVASAKQWAMKMIGRECPVLIGMDFSIGQGDPAAIQAGVLMIPIALVLALVLPGISFFPTSLLPNLIVYTCVGSLACHGNLFRVMVGSCVLVVFMLYAQTWMVPLTTQ